jgi:DASS family divalent anion:Na+ symporter
MFLMPLILFVLYKPELSKTPDAPEMARKKLKEMGPMSRNEKIVLSIFGLLLLLWAGVPEMLLGVKVNATAATFLGLSLMLIAGVLSWDEVLKEKGAWDTIIWFAALVMMATFLNKLGLISWLAESLRGGIQAMGLNWVWGCASLALAYIYSHYMFASGTAHVTAMFGAFYAAGVALGAPPMLYALILAAATDIMMSLTHYASGSSPVIYGSNYVTMGEWWKAGFIMSVFEILVFCTVGVAWWGILGYF